ncbi:MAG: hypothetical protein WDN06_04660 [Asticcacaulis sp.]
MAPSPANWRWAVRGCKGTAQLSDVDGDQGAVISATGNNVNLPGDLPGNFKVHIGRTIITANAVIRKELELTADVQAADATYAGVTVSTRTRQGTAAWPDRHRPGGGIRKQGCAVQCGRQRDDRARPADGPPPRARPTASPFALDHPARLSKSGDDWVVAPVTVVMDGGKVDFGGRLRCDEGGSGAARRRRPQCRQPVPQRPRHSGKANGQVDFRQSGNGFPTAHADLTVNGFSRASAAVVSTPVDIAVEAALDPSLGASANYAHAIVRQGGAVIGRVQAELSPAQGGGWVEQILNAGISGGVRYNGPRRRTVLAGRPGTPAAFRSHRPGPPMSPASSTLLNSTGLVRADAPDLRQRKPSARASPAWRSAAISPMTGWN